MSWIQENKFVDGLAGVTAVIGGAILYFGNAQGNAYDEKMLEFDGLKSEHTKLAKAKPYPDSKNLKTREGLIKQYGDVIGNMRKALIGYQPGKLEKLTPVQFSDAQIKMQTELRAAFGAAETTLPENCGFGFEKYATIQAKATATARLNFQLNAMQWALNKLAESKPAALINIRREDLAVESGAVATTSPVRRGRPGQNRRGGPRGAAADDNAYVLMPVELAFTTTEASLRDFLKEMANSKEYYYAIRAIRIRNEKQTPPTIKDADFHDGGGGGGGGGAAVTPDDPFGGIVLPDEGGDGDDPEEAPAPKPVADGERILQQVLGKEKLNVYMTFDVLLIKGDRAAKSDPDSDSDPVKPVPVPVPVPGS